MFTFSIVKKIGEGKYLREERFIIERIRKARALDTDRIQMDRHSEIIKKFSRNERIRPS